MKSKILLIEDNRSFYDRLHIALRPYPVEIEWASTGSDGIKAYRKNIHGFATVVVDYELPDTKGSAVTTTIRKINPAQDFLFTTAHVESDRLIDLLETGGARTMLFKKRSDEELIPKILDSIAIYERQNRVIGFDNYEPERAEVELRAAGFIGRSALMHDRLEKINKYADSPYPVLIVGATGTGKELVARALAKNKNMIIVNCPRYEQSENLLEAELFGYVKGAFTGAIENNPGLLAQAHGQVVFLDELHRLSLSAQAKLLRFLNDMKYRRVGDNTGREIQINFKLIAAAKPDIYQMMKEDKFLEDLYHRVCQLEIKVPSLRERPEDIEPLARSIQNEFNKDRALADKRQLRLSTIFEMEKHEWTGNVRELQGAVRRMLTDAKRDIVEPVDFAKYLEGIKNEIAPPPAMKPLEQSLKSFETEQIISALKKSYTQTVAASILGISPSSLNKKLERLGLSPEMFLLTT